LGAFHQLERATVLKVDADLGLVFGWAIICKENDQDYYDLNVDRDGAMKGQRVPEHISEDVMLEAAFDFAAKSERPGNEMHAGPAAGSHVFLFPLTSDIAKALDITTKRTGLLVAYHPPADVLAKFKDGSYTGFSIEGYSDPQKNELIDA
jgi:hypothetical protein